MDEKQRILIVDDERLNINVLNDLLKDNYKIMAAINGEQGVKAALSDTPPDLILLDIMMPEMNGFEVCKILKENEKSRDIPIIFVTALNSIPDEIMGLEAGAVDFITKPITPAIVEARIKTHLTIKKQLTELNRAYNIINSQKQLMKNELDIAQDIQLSMLPDKFPENTNFVVNALMVAAKEVGGDFYDFFFIDKDNFCICIGDVSGKGVPAALFMAVTKSLIKSRCADDRSPGSVLTHVNNELVLNNDSCMFVTVFVLMLNIKTGDCLYSNAGHNPPFIKKGSGEIVRLSERHGVVLGAIEGSTYKESSISLTMNDTIILYTDGVTESMNRENRLFGEDKLIDVIKGNKEPVEIVYNIFSNVKEYEDGLDQTDDITTLVLKYWGENNTPYKQELDIEILNLNTEIEKLLDGFEEFAVTNLISKDNIFRINTVFDEVISNIISYGYTDNKKHVIKIKIELFSNILTINIIDDGIPYNPLLNKRPETTSSISDRAIGGLGIHIVKNIMDETVYKRKINFNHLVMIKNLDLV